MFVSCVFDFLVADFLFFPLFSNLKEKFTQKTKILSIFQNLYANVFVCVIKKDNCIKIYMLKIDIVDCQKTKKFQSKSSKNSKKDKTTIKYHENSPYDLCALYSNFQLFILFYFIK